MNLSRSLQRLRARDLLGLCAIALLLAGIALDPHGDPRRVRLLGFYVPTGCGLRLLTGYPCLTCGLTRSVCHAVRGEIGLSASRHPMGPAFALALALQTVFWIASLAIPRVRAMAVSSSAVGWAYAALFVAIALGGLLRLLGLFAWPPA